MYVNVYIPDNIPIDESGYISGIISNSIVKKNDIFTIIISSNIEPQLSDGTIGSLNDNTLGFQNEMGNWISLQTMPNITIDELVIKHETVDLLNIMTIVYKSTDIEESVILKNVNGDHLDPLGCFAKFSEMNLLSHQRKYNEVKWCWLRLIITTLPLYYKLLFVMEVFLLKCDIFFEQQLGVKSSFLKQILLRIKQVKYVSKFSNISKNYLSICRLVGIIVMDVLLGILCVYLLFSYTSSSEIHTKVKSTASILAGNVQRLLMQLRGAPAGLKLNQPLTEAYATFFSYIVYLWTIYLDRANSAMAIVSYFFMFVGVLGLSAQAALMADVFNLVSLHIYCVYVYAARIHMLQVSIVGSQWRAFRGKKWNPLKERCDCLDEHSQRPLRKILTVFVFTVVVFLLPTTTVYYAVFVLMRLCFVCLNGFITMFIWSLNYNPVFVFIQYVMESPKIKGDIHFETMPIDDCFANGLPLLKMKLQRSSFSKIIEVSNDPKTIPPFPSPNLTSLYTSLVYAQSLF